MTEREEMANDFNKWAQKHARDFVTRRNPLLDMLLETPKQRWKRRYRLERLHRRGALATVSELVEGKISDFHGITFVSRQRVAKDSWLEL